MEIGLQELTLARIIDKDTQETLNYYLHSVTYVSDCRYLAVGHSVLEGTNDNGYHVVEVYLELTESIYELPFETPATHVIDLKEMGLLNLVNQDIVVEAIAGNIKKTSEPVNQSSAHDIFRPIDLG